MEPQEQPLYLTPTQYRAMSRLGRRRLAHLDDAADIVPALQAACQRCDSACNVHTWGYRQEYREQARWNPDIMRFSVKQKPLRVVQELVVSLGVITLGSPGNLALTVFPNEVTPDPTVLPTVFGGIRLGHNNRRQLYVTISAITQQVYSMVQTNPDPHWYVTYTCGYDAGWLDPMDPQSANPAAAPTAAPAALPAINPPPPGVDVGGRVYAVTGIDAAGTESILSTHSAAVSTSGGSGQAAIQLSELPTAFPGIDAPVRRRIYRSAANTTSPLRFVDTLTDPTAAGYLDIRPDSSLGYTKVDGQRTPAGDDGYVLPYPAWLREAAARETDAELLWREAGSYGARGMVERAGGVQYAGGLPTMAENGIVCAAAWAHLQSHALFSVGAA